MWSIWKESFEGTELLLFKSENSLSKVSLLGWSSGVLTLSFLEFLDLWRSRSQIFLHCISCIFPVQSVYTFFITSQYLSKKLLFISFFLTIKRLIKKMGTSFCHEGSTPSKLQPPHISSPLTMPTHVASRLEKLQRDFFGGLDWEINLNFIWWTWGMVSVLHCRREVWEFGYGNS